MVNRNPLLVAGRSRKKFKGYSILDARAPSPTEGEREGVRGNEYPVSSIEIQDTNNEI